MSVGKANISIDPDHQNQNIFNKKTTFVVSIYDSFNFDEFRPLNSFGNLANNVGFILQYSGNLTPYNWDVKFYITN